MIASENMGLGATETAEKINAILDINRDTNIIYIPERYKII